MKLVLAQDSDSDRLKDFFAKMTLSGAIDFSIRRHGRFSDHYLLQGEQHQTLLLQDDKEQLQGMCSLLYKTGFVNGEKQIFGYATDLRIAPTRHAIIEWAQLFLPFMERALAERGCHYVFSAIEQTEGQAYNALLRPQQSRRRFPRYYLLRKFRLMAIHGLIPFAPKPVAAISLHRATLNDVDELCAYLRKKGQDRPIGLIYEPSDFLERLQRWPGMNLDDFILARDKSGRLIGCTAPWSGSHVQSFVPVAYHGEALANYQTFKALSFLGLAKRLPKRGVPFQLKHLTHLAVDHGEVLYAFIVAALKSSLPQELVCYAHFKGHMTTMPPKSLWTTSLPYGLYTILPPQKTLPDWLQPNPWRTPPEFDSAIL